MNEIITSLQNPQVKIWRGLNKSRSARLEAGLFLAEGEHMAGEALKENKVRALLIDERAKSPVRIEIEEEGIHVKCTTANGKIDEFVELADSLGDVAVEVSAD